MAIEVVGDESNGTETHRHAAVALGVACDRDFKSTVDGELYPGNGEWRTAFPGGLNGVLFDGSFFNSFMSRGNAAIGSKTSFSGEYSSKSRVPIPDDLKGGPEWFLFESFFELFSRLDMYSTFGVNKPPWHGTIKHFPELAVLLGSRSGLGI